MADMPGIDYEGAGSEQNASVALTGELTRGPHGEGGKGALRRGPIQVGRAAPVVHEKPSAVPMGSSRRAGPWAPRRRGGELHGGRGASADCYEQD